MLIFQIIHLIIAALLITSVLLQQRGSGLGDAFGDVGTTYSSRRGAEKILFYLTIIFGTAFLAIALMQLIIF